MDLEFNYRMMKFECTCGQEELKVKVGINSQSDLVCKWNCKGCNKPVMALLPLSKLVADSADIPEVQQEAEEPKPEPKLLSPQSDRNFLKDMGIEDDGA